MSSMLEQAIADAATLREQAIKNAEQSVLDKYSKQIKEAVDQMLEQDDAPQRAESIISEVEEELMEQEEAPAVGGGNPDAAIEAPPAWDSRFDDISTKLTAMVDNLPEDADGMIELDLGDFSIPEDEEMAASGAPEQPESDLGDLGEEEPAEEGGDDLDSLLGDLEAEPEGDEEMDVQLQEVLKLLEEEMEFDYDPINDELGKFQNNRSRKEYNQEAAEFLYEEESSEEEKVDEEKEELMGRVNELHETVKNLTQQNSQLERVLTKLEIHLEESLLSNAKLLYQNRTLSDASLNERQKSKIVEAISNAESPKEAKNLHETLKATVGSTPNGKKGPESLSESVNRRSNLSSMLNSRQNINESKQNTDPFMEKMQKLAGIKK